MSEPDNIAFLIDPNGQQHLLSNPANVLGRAVENDVVIAHRRVSREHARITRQGRRYILEDLGSTNGTLLNGERLATPTELRDGDRLTIGDLTLVFHDPDTTARDSGVRELEVNLDARLVRVDRCLVSLSPKEYALLAYLYQHPGKVCSKDEIGAAVWTEYQEGVFDYQIENLVRRLRTKIESDPNNPQILLTARGLGYRFVLP